MKIFIRVILFKRRRLKKILGYVTGTLFIVIYLFFSGLRCHVREYLFGKITPQFDQLNIENYGVARPSSSNKDPIVILTRKISPAVTHRLKQLDSAFFDHFQTSLLILHTGNNDRNDLIHLTNQIKRPVLFLNIESVFYSFPAEFHSCCTRPTWSSGRRWNYHLMIRFWFKILFELPQLRQYEYIMRFDDDSKMTDSWFNVFDEMRRKRAVYFANDIDMDEEKSLPGTMKLKQMTDEYREAYNITVKQPKMLKNGFGDGSILSYFNNFEVLKVDFFREEFVRHWTKTVDQTYGIFKYRWGDAILRYITIALFAEEHQVLHRSQYNLSYCHKC